MKILTQEQIVKSISAAYDSVNLITLLETIIEPTQEDIDSIKRNKEHLLIMLSKEDFVNGCTEKEINDFKASTI